MKFNWNRHFIAFIVHNFRQHVFLNPRLFRILDKAIPLCKVWTCIMQYDYYKFVPTRLLLVTKTDFNPIMIDRRIMIQVKLYFVIISFIGPLSKGLCLSQVYHHVYLISLIIHWRGQFIDVLTCIIVVCCIRYFSGFVRFAIVWWRVLHLYVDWENLSFATIIRWEMIEEFASVDAKFPLAQNRTVDRDGENIFEIPL